jgi:hypothetical protein
MTFLNRIDKANINKIELLNNNYINGDPEPYDLIVETGIAGLNQNIINKSLRSLFEKSSLTYQFDSEMDCLFPIISFPYSFTDSLISIFGVDNKHLFSIKGPNIIPMTGNFGIHDTNKLGQLNDNKNGLDILIQKSEPIKLESMNFRKSYYMSILNSNLFKTRSDHPGNVYFDNHYSKRQNEKYDHGNNCLDIDLVGSFKDSDIYFENGSDNQNKFRKDNHLIEGQRNSNVHKINQDLSELKKQLDEIQFELFSNREGSRSSKNMDIKQIFDGRKNKLADSFKRMVFEAWIEMFRKEVFKHGGCL